jgi:hypothetical protein
MTDLEREELIAEAVTSAPEAFAAIYQLQLGRITVPQFVDELAHLAEIAERSLFPTPSLEQMREDAGEAIHDDEHDRGEVIYGDGGVA